MQVPEQTRQKIQQIENYRNQLEQIVQAKNQFENELEEMKVAKKEINNLDDEEVYKSVGSFFMKSNKEKAMNEIEDRLDTLEVKLDRHKKKEKQLKERLEKLQEEIQGKLQGMGGGQAG